jgi:type II secretory pathway pseudopilin PulG
MPKKPLVVGGIMGNVMRYRNKEVVLPAVPFFGGDFSSIGNSGQAGRLMAGLTIVEVVLALAIMVIVFAAILPEFRAIQNSWGSKADNAEIIQNSRVLTDHLYRNLSKARRITAVSNSDNTNGYIEFENTDGDVLRYDIRANNYVEFGAVDELSELAGPVSSLKFTCYDAFDLDNPLDMRTADVNDIRTVKIQATLPNPSRLGQDKTVAAQVYIRSNPSLESENIDLVGWWKLDETSGTTASDSSGNGNHGTLINMGGSSGWVTGKDGGALNFDGRNDCVQVPDSPSFNIEDQITVAAWINPEDTWSWRTIVSKFAHTHYHCRTDLYWFLYSRKIGISLAGPCGSSDLWRPDVYIPTDVWTHVALTYDGSEMVMYKNGVAVADRNERGTLELADSSSDEPFYIGNNTEWGEYFDGKIDDVRIYRRALNVDEIAALCWEQPLVAHWKLDETSGTTASDSSDNGNHGTLKKMNPPEWVEGKVGGALDFDGYDDYVEVPDSPSLHIADGISILAWINPDDNDNWRTIASKFAHVPYCRTDLYWFLYNRRIGASLAGPCGTCNLWRPNVRISEDEWTHVALTYDGSDMVMYKDGDRESSTDASGSLMLAASSSNESFYIGKNTEWHNEYFDGTIDDLRLYKSALSDDQIETIYNGGELSGFGGQSTPILP